MNKSNFLIHCLAETKRVRSIVETADVCSHNTCIVIYWHLNCHRNFHFTEFDLNWVRWWGTHCLFWLIKFSNLWIFFMNLLQFQFLYKYIDLYRISLLNEDINKTNSLLKAAQNIIYYEITPQEFVTADGHRFFFRNSSRILWQSSGQKIETYKAQCYLRSLFLLALPEI